MAIQGTEAPKFVSGGNTVLLDYALIERNDPETDTRMIESEVTGNRDFWSNANRTVVIRVNLYKESSPATKYHEIVDDYLFTEVSLYLHRDGNAFEDADGNDVPFLFESCERVYLEQSNYQYAILLTFTSTKPVNMVETVS